jgi:hypothetical protein
MHHYGALNRVELAVVQNSGSTLEAFGHIDIVRVP